MIGILRPNVSADSMRFGKKTFPEKYEDTNQVLFHTAPKNSDKPRYFYQSSNVVVFDSSPSLGKKCFPAPPKSLPQNLLSLTRKHFQIQSQTDQDLLLQIKAGKKCYSPDLAVKNYTKHMKPGIKCFPSDSLKSTHSTFQKTLLKPTASYYHTKLNQRNNGVFVNGYKTSPTLLPEIK